MALLRGYRPASGMERFGRVLRQEGVRQLEKERTAQLNIELALSDAEEMTWTSGILGRITDSVDVGDGAVSDEEGKLSRNWYDENWTPGEKKQLEFVKTREGLQKVTTKNIVDKERIWVIAQEHYESESIRKENAIYKVKSEQMLEGQVYNSRKELDLRVEVDVAYLESAYNGRRISGLSTLEEFYEQTNAGIRAQVSSYIMQHPDKIGKDGKLIKDYYLDNPNEITEEMKFGKIYNPDHIRDLKKEYRRRKNAADAARNDEFDNVTGKTALDWDVKLQAWDDPSSENKLTYDDINALQMPGFEDEFGNDIIKFKEFWRGLLDAKIEAKKEGGDDTTSTENMIKAEMLIRSVGGRRITLQKALVAYSKIAPDIKSTDNKSYLARLFATEEATRVSVKQIMSDKLASREKQLGDSINADPSVFVRPEERDALRDHANEALIRLGDMFGDLEWEDDKELDKAVDELKREYSLSAKALVVALRSDRLIKAETYKEQVEAMQEQLKALRNQRIDKYREVLDKGVRLGLVNPDGTAPTKSGEKVNLKKLGFMDILEEIAEQI